MIHQATVPTAVTAPLVAHPMTLVQLDTTVRDQATSPSARAVRESLCWVYELLAQYCPTGSLTPQVCPAGYYCPTPEEKIICPEGFFCKIGSISPRSKWDERSSLMQ